MRTKYRICTTPAALAGAATLLLGLILLSAPGAATGATDVLSCWTTATAANGRPAGRRYLLGPGDRIRINVYQRVDLTAEFEIREDGHISFPIVGHLRAAGHDVLELERAVSRAMEGVSGRAVPVSVEVVQRRPLYIVGQVNTPGVYPYGVGMTVLHAVALAGGYFRPALGGGAIVDVSRESGRISQSMATLKRDLARLARLEAEREGTDTIEPPERLRELEAAERIEVLMDAERRLLEQRADALHSEAAAHENGIKLVQEEIAALQSQHERVVQQVALARRELDTLKDLSSRGLSRRNELFAVERTVANIEADEREIFGRVARAKKSLADAERDRNLLAINNKLRIQQELVAVSDQIFANELAVESSKRVIDDLSLAPVSGQDDGPPPMIYQIVRSDGSEQRTLDADEATSLCPGDVVRISVRR